MLDVAPCENSPEVRKDAIVLSDNSLDMGERLSKKNSFVLRKCLVKVVMALDENFYSRRLLSDPSPVHVQHCPDINDHCSAFAIV